MQEKDSLGEKVMEYDVEEGIPIPPVAVASRESKYPFKNMKVGSSFFVAQEEDESADDAYHRVMTAAATFKRRSNAYCWIFTTRRLVEHGVSGVRIWRIG